MPDNIGLSPRQQDIYEQMREEGIPMPDGKIVTPQWVKNNYPSTPIQPRCKKKTSPKTKRKKKVKK
jgi:hypothetical protein